MTNEILRGSARASRGAIIVACFVVGLHAALLLISLPDYLADNDLGFHISLGRQYGEHGTYWWDHLNWAPSGRPNLQGPLLHLSIGVLGRILGGEGDDYVLAFSLLAVLQWASAVFTTFWFSRRFGGDWAALIAVALLTGCIWSAAPFFVGVPSGWIFILTPWAVHFFLEEKYLAATLLTTAVMYVHLGGSPVAPFGILLAALFTRNWKGLLKVGAGCAVLASPYLVHFLIHLEWYTGRRGHVAGEFALLTYLLALPGLILVLRRPREHLLLLLWLASPIAWLIQDSNRFLLQESLVLSAIAGLFLAWTLGRVQSRRIRRVIAIAIVTVATVFPLSIPSLPIEAAWAFGFGFPRELDWKEARTLASVREEAALGDRIVNSYYDSLSAAIAVYSPLRQEFGHWGEVRPAVNPARDISAGAKLYVMPLPPDDEVLQRFQGEGRLRVLGGSDRTSLVILTVPGRSNELIPGVISLIYQETRWLAERAVNNRMPAPVDLFHPERIEDFRQTMTIQRNHVGRIQVGVLILAFALEAEDPEFARAVRSSARGWGSVANFVGDETAINYLSDERFERFRVNIRAWGEALLGWSEGRTALSEVDELTDRLFEEFFG